MLPLYHLALFSLILSVYGDFQPLALPVKSKREILQSYLADNMHGVIEKGYYVEAFIGTPPQGLNILIDTGSSNFAVASKANSAISTYYKSEESTTAVDMKIQDIDIEYTEGFWKGHLVTDLVTIPSANLSIQARVSIAEITESKKFFINGSGWQGILGMGYTELVRPNDPAVDSFMDRVVQDTGMDDIFSLQLCMANVREFSDAVSGTFIMGGYDHSVKPIYWTSVVREWYYDVLVLGMKVGNFTVPVDCNVFNNDKSIVDSGTTNLRFPRKIFEGTIKEMQKHLQSVKINVKEAFWGGKDVLCWDKTVDPYQLFPMLTIYLPSVEYNYTIILYVHAQHYILFNGNDTESKSDKACYKFGISPSDTGTVLGAVLMEEYNVIFDRANRKVGFGLSDCSSTSKLSYTEGYPNSTSCVYSNQSSLTGMQIALYVLLGILLLCMLPVCLLTYAWCCKKRTDSPGNDTDNLLNNPTIQRQ